MTEVKPVLSVNNLTVEYKTPQGNFRAIENVSFNINKGEIVALVGESGSGKSTISLSIMNLLPPSAKIVSGSIIFDGKDMLSMKEEELTKIRGSKIAMIFQEPVSYLNPVLKIGKQIEESIMIHNELRQEEAKSRALMVLKKVKMPDPVRLYNYYPHQLSGGMAQRACIAIAIANNPSLLIADEPTASLDLTIQAQILHLLKELRQETGMSILIISHDLRLVSGIADKVITLYAGKIAEVGPVQEIFYNPLHPYTRMLMKSSAIEVKNVNLEPYEPKGSLPDPFNPSKGCKFSPRCPHSFEKCSLEPIALSLGNEHVVFCWLYG